LVDKPRQGPNALERIRLDAYVGMAFSNLVALAIIIATAATLHTAGITDIETSSQAAEALKPIAGPFAFAVFTPVSSGRVSWLSPYWPVRPPMR
jgi:Mn2+/Fe2+ NRAMP family transporter